MNKNSSKSIIFDGQVFQSAAWDRGMGKYSLSFLSAIMKNNRYPYENTYLVFNKHLPLTPEAKKSIKRAAPKAKFVFLDLKIPKVLPREDLSGIKQTNKKLLENFISDEIGSDAKTDFIILALFIDQVCSVFPKNARRILLFYDLIPLQYPERYSKMWSYPNYLSRFETIYEADQLLTISQTVADDLMVYTGIDTEKICSIDGAPIERDTKKSKKPAIDVPKHYILMPTGNEMRKNNRRAIEAFEEYRMATGNVDQKLLITSHFDAKTKAELCKVSDNVIFTDNVSEEELGWLYEHTDTLLFVSEYEGLGLPVLEALEVNKPVVCSNIKVFNEMSPTAFYYADPYNPSSIALQLEFAAKKVDFSQRKAEYKSILARYSWDQTAQKAINFLASSVYPVPATKPRLAVFAPTPGGYSAIGKVVMLLHSALSEFFEVDYYTETGKSGNTFDRPNFLPSVARVYPAARFTPKLYAEYDAVLYHVGNSEYHMETMIHALFLPGYIIVHDTRLKELFEDVLHRFAYIHTGRLEAERQLNGLMGSNKVSYMTSLLHANLGVITHSEYAKDAIGALPIETPPIRKINLPTSVPEISTHKLGKRFSAGFGGIIHKAKGIGLVDEIVNATDTQDIDLYIFGVPLIEQSELDRLQTYPNIIIEKNLSDFAFENRLSEMDVIINYRARYNGETSLTVIEAMRHGVVPIVRRVGWFDELPDECVEKVDSESEIVDALRRLRENKNGYLDNKKRAAKQYAREHHSYRQYAQNLYDFITGADTSGDSTSLKVAKSLKQKASLQNIEEILKDS